MRREPVSPASECTRETREKRRKKKKKKKATTPRREKGKRCEIEDAGFVFLNEQNIFFECSSE